MVGLQKKYFGIANYTVMMRRKNHTLDYVNAVVDWHPISKFLDKKIQCKDNVGETPS